MIIKSFEINKIDIQKYNYFLLYGENQGHKNEIIEKKFKKFYSENIYNYEEGEILSNIDGFFNSVLSKSFFEDKKLVIISRVTDKISDLIEEVIEKDIQDIIFVLNANTLEKKSKIRSFFEKNKKTTCIPFYEDNNQTLSIIINKFFRDKKIPISQQAMNLIIQRCRGDRQNLVNEMDKIESFTKNKKKVEIEDLLKLTNLAENFSVSELIDSCLARNKRKTLNILNENNYSLEDCILIIRTLLIKAKRILKLVESKKDSENIDDIITRFKPPIFWKDKEIVKQQMNCWTYNGIENLTYKISEIELLIKKNPVSSINILSDFIIEQSSLVNNKIL